MLKRAWLELRNTGLRGCWGSDAIPTLGAVKGTPLKYLFAILFETCKKTPAISTAAHQTGPKEQSLQHRH